MPPNNVLKWEIYHLYCTQTTPDKYKFIVVVCVAPTFCLGLPINSRINRFIEDRPHLLPCEASITAAEHSFLKYDSFVDCRDAFSFSAPDFTDLKGVVSIRARQEIIESVRVCPVLRNRYKRLILEE